MYLFVFLCVLLFLSDCDARVHISFDKSPLNRSYFRVPDDSLMLFIGFWFVISLHLPLFIYHLLPILNTLTHSIFYDSLRPHFHWINAQRIKSNGHRVLQRVFLSSLLAFSMTSSSSSFSPSCFLQITRAWSSKIQCLSNVLRTIIYSLCLQSVNVQFIQFNDRLNH